MIAARLAGGNLFLAFWGWGIFLVGDFGSTRSSSERLGALGFFLSGGFWEHSEHSDDFSGGWGVFWIVSVGKN